MTLSLSSHPSSSRLLLASSRVRSGCRHHRRRQRPVRQRQPRSFPPRRALPSPRGHTRGVGTGARRLCRCRRRLRWWWWCFCRRRGVASHQRGDGADTGGIAASSVEVCCPAGHIARYVPPLARLLSPLRCSSPCLHSPHLLPLTYYCSRLAPWPVPFANSPLASSPLAALATRSRLLLHVR